MFLTYPWRYAYHTLGTTAIKHKIVTLNIDFSEYAVRSNFGKSTSDPNLDHLREILTNGL